MVREGQPQRPTQPRSDPVAAVAAAHACGRRLTFECVEVQLGWRAQPEEVPAGGQITVKLRRQRLREHARQGIAPPTQHCVHDLAVCLQCAIRERDPDDAGGEVCRPAATA